MKKAEYAASKGLTLQQLRDEMESFLQNEGYDDAGNEYQTIDAWIARKPAKPLYEPSDGGRGVGSLGNRMD